MTRITTRKLTDAERTVIYVVGQTLWVNGTEQGDEWKFSIVMTGDCCCHVFASPEKGFNLYNTNMVALDFYSLAEMRDKVEAALVKARVPEAITAAILTAIPDFLIYAEDAYHRNQFVYRPD